MPDVPKELERIILRCLRKEPERRFQHMTDLKVELQELKEESDSAADGPGRAGPSEARPLAGGGAGGGAGMAAGGLLLWRSRASRSGLPRPSSR